MPRKVDRFPLSSRIGKLAQHKVHGSTDRGRGQEVSGRSCLVVEFQGLITICHLLQMETSNIYHFNGLKFFLLHHQHDCRLLDIMSPPWIVSSGTQTTPRCELRSRHVAQQNATRELRNHINDYNAPLWITAQLQDPQNLPRASKNPKNVHAKTQYPLIFTT